MLEAIIGLALLPFAIAVGIGIIATIFLIVTKGYKFITVILLGLATVLALLSRVDWYWIIGLGLATIFALLWAVDEHQPTTEPVENLQD